MVKHIFCIKDELVGFLDPAFEFNSDVAIRKFKYSLFELLQSDQASLHPVEDFNLYELGTFNVGNAEFVSTSPKLIYTGSRVKKEFYDLDHKEKSLNEVIE